MVKRKDMSETITTPKFRTCLHGLYGLSDYLVSINNEKNGRIKNYHGNNLTPLPRQLTLPLVYTHIEGAFVSDSDNARF